MTRMNEVTIRGIVGNGKCAPCKKFITDSKTSKKVPIMWFTMLYNDNMWKDDEGKNQYNRKYLKVFLPRNSYGEGLYRNIACGRQTEVTGVVKADVYSRTKEDGSSEHLPSLVMSDASIQFLDLPLEKQVRNILDIVQEYDLIDDKGNFKCNAKEFVDTVCEYAGQLKGKVIEEDNSQSQSTGTNKRSF